MSKPSVLFVCVHNAGRSQMAAGYLTHLAGDRVEVRSAGSQPADQINPIAVAAMAEDGIDITTEQPKILTTDAVQASDVVITMGCGDTCPVFPGKRYEDWDLDDPAGQGIDAVRPIRDDIKARINDLIVSLGITAVRKPSVLFVCAKNGGKSQMAAALMRQHAGDRVDVYSAGTHPGPSLNPESVASLEEVGATTTGEHPKPIDPALLDTVDRIVILGNDAVIEDPGSAPIERWDTDEPSLRGITGMERMRLIRDDITTRVEDLAATLLADARR